MCARIKPNLIIIDRCCQEEDCSLGDFRKILVMCKSNRQELFVLYCYVIAYVCKFAEYQPWVTNYAENHECNLSDFMLVIKSADGSYLRNEKVVYATKYIPRNAFVMIEKLLQVYNSEFLFHQDESEYQTKRTLIIKDMIVSS